MSEPDLTAASILFGPLIDPGRSQSGPDWAGAAAYASAEENKRVQHWCAGWSEGPYLPNPDTVMHGGSIEEARDHLIADVENELEAWEELHPSVRKEFARVRAELYDLDLDKLEADAEHARADGGNWESWACGWQYWMMPCFTPHCDQLTDDE